jgi:hypothetical protein
MNALGKTCGSEYCDQVLKIQDGKDAIGCTKAQQAEEDVGDDKCEFGPSPIHNHSILVYRARHARMCFVKSLLTQCAYIGLESIPGGVLVD